MAAPFSDHRIKPASIEHSTAGCPVCIRFDTYRKEDHFYDTANGPHITALMRPLRGVDHQTSLRPAHHVDSPPMQAEKPGRVMTKTRSRSGGCQATHNAG